MAKNIEDCLQVKQVKFKSPVTEKIFITETPEPLTDETLYPALHGESKLDEYAKKLEEIKRKFSELVAEKGHLNFDPNADITKWFMWEPLRRAQNGDSPSSSSDLQSYNPGKYSECESDEQLCFTPPFFATENMARENSDEMNRNSNAPSIDNDAEKLMVALSYFAQQNKECETPAITNILNAASNMEDDDTQEKLRHTLESFALLSQECKNLSEGNMNSNNASNNINNNAFRKQQRYHFDSDPLAKRFFPCTVAAKLQFDDMQTRQSESTATKEYNREALYTEIDRHVKEREEKRKESMILYGKNMFKDWVSPLKQYEHLLRSKCDVPKFYPSTVTPSPYLEDLVRLRIDRLKIDEDFLLENRRQKEMERLSGPTPGWYCLKDKSFYNELVKNNNVLRSWSRWQEIGEHMEALERASDKFKEKYHMKAQQHETIVLNALFSTKDK